MSLSTLNSQLSAKRSVATFNALHLGDNLVHLHFLRKLAAKYPEIHFIHGAQGPYLDQLDEVVADLPNITLDNIAHTGQGAINAWMGAGGWWYQQPSTADWCAAALRWFTHLAKEMGLASPFLHARDLLFDYPALARKQSHTPVDFLLVNSPPQSGQFCGYDQEAFANFARMLWEESGGSVITTAPTWSYIESTSELGLSVTGIGQIAQRAKCIIGPVTGPMWPCLNIWNADTVQLRVHLQDRERVDMLPDRTVNANHLSLVPEILRDRGLLL